MIDKWFREDIEHILKTKNRVVIAAEDKNAGFLYDLIPAEYQRYKTTDDIDELKTKYEIEKMYAHQKVVIFCTSSREKLKFLREYCETNGCVDIKYLHNYVKEMVHSKLQLNLQLTPHEIITAAKLSIGRRRDYWLDIVHKGKDRIMDIGHEIIPFLNDPEQYCQKLDDQVKKEFYVRINAWLGRENFEQPPATLAREAAAKILCSLLQEDGEKKFKKIYQKWADSKTYEKSLNHYIEETQIEYGDNIWAVDVSHPFSEIDREWLNEITQNLTNPAFIKAKMDLIKRRASNKIGKKAFETVWDDILALLEFDAAPISRLNTFDAVLTFYIDKFYRLDSAVRRLYAKFLNEPDMIQPIQEYYNGVLMLLLDKWHCYFREYRENQSNILFDTLKDSQVKCAIIIGDGIPFEISKIISAKLKNRYSVVDSYKRADFPSTTENNMSRIYMGPGKIEALHKKREQALQRKYNDEIRFSPLHEINYATETSGHLICTYNDIDSIAGKMQQNALKYISQMETELVEKIDLLINCGYKTVWLTSDHGFVLTGLLSESDKIEFDLGALQ